MGGLVYTTAFSSDGSTIQQTQYWTELVRMLHVQPSTLMSFLRFIGGSGVGNKNCNPPGHNPPGDFENTLDPIGLCYNKPNAAKNSPFEEWDAGRLDVTV